MANVPLSWKLSISGAEEVKTRLRDVNQQFDSGEISASKYAKELRAIGRDARSFNQVQNLQKNIFLASHPGVLKLSKAMSTFGSVMRTALTISNALNLSKIASSGINSEVISVENELAAAIRAYNEAVAEGDPEKIQAAAEKVAELKARLEEVKTAAEQAKFDGFITAVASIGTTISTAFNTLLQSETIRNAIFKGASKLGTLFAGVFTGFSTLIMKAATWINNALFGSGEISKAAIKGGTTHGRLYGTAWGIAAGLAAAAGAVLLLDLVNEVLTGKSTLEDIQKRLGVPEDQQITGTGVVKDVTGIDLKPKRDPRIHKPGGIEPAGGAVAGLGGPILNIIPRLIEQVDKAFRGQDNIFKPLIDIFQKGIPEAYGESERVLSQPLTISEQADQTSIFQPLIDLFTITIPEAYESAKTSFTQVWLTDIPTILTEASSIISGGFNNLWNGVIGATNFAGQSMTEGLNTIFGSLIAHMNTLIAAYNRAAKKLGKPTIEPIVFVPASFTALESIPAIAAATGFSGTVSKPTLFLAGEAGAESVEITPNASRGRGGSSNQTIIVNVNGSILAEKELLKMVDNHQKSNLKRRGFTGI